MAQLATKGSVRRGGRLTVRTTTSRLAASAMGRPITSAITGKQGVLKKRLPTEIFRTKTGKNYLRSRTLNQAAIRLFFREQGYRVRYLRQHWRHLYGKLEKNGRAYFVKVASTKDIGLRTHNEVLWNQQVREAVRKHKMTHLTVPKIYDTGLFKDKFYFVSGFYDGPPVATANPPDTTRLKRWMDKVVTTNLFLLDLKEVELTELAESEHLGTDWRGYLKLVGRMYREVPNNHLSKILTSARELKETYEPGINHGDYNPWHMIAQNNRIVLVDGEWASTRTPRYYDIAYCYHKLYTGSEDPELAKLYLNKVRQQLKPRQRQRMEQAIRPLIACRLIWEFWEAKHERSSVIYRQRLKEDFLADELW